MSAENFSGVCMGASVFPHPVDCSACKSADGNDQHVSTLEEKGGGDESINSYVERVLTLDASLEWADPQCFRPRARAAPAGVNA